MKIPKNGSRRADRPRRPSAEADRPTHFLIFIGKSIFHFLFFYFIIILIENTGRFIFYIIPKAPRGWQT